LSTHFLCDQNEITVEMPHYEVMIKCYFANEKVFYIYKSTDTQMMVERKTVTGRPTCSQFKNLIYVEKQNNSLLYHKCKGSVKMRNLASVNRFSGTQDTMVRMWDIVAKTGWVATG